STHLLVYSSFPTRRSSDLVADKVDEVPADADDARRLNAVPQHRAGAFGHAQVAPALDLLLDQRLDRPAVAPVHEAAPVPLGERRSEEHTSELQSRGHLVCR